MLLPKPFCARPHSNSNKRKVLAERFLSLVSACTTRTLPNVSFASNEGRTKSENKETNQPRLYHDKALPRLHLLDLAYTYTYSLALVG